MVPNVLIVYDELATRGLLDNLLRQTGLHACAAPDGEACLELADRAQPQVILLDENLPDISGIEACRRLKATEGTRNIPVIMFIGKGSNRGGTAEAGALDYLVKPFRVEELLDRVKAAICVRHLTEPIERLMAYMEALDENRTGFG